VSTASWRGNREGWRQVMVVAVSGFGGRRGVNGVEVLWNPVNRRVTKWESEAGMVKHRRMRSVFLKHRGHRGHRVLGRNPVNSAIFANVLVLRVLHEFSCCFSYVSPSQGEAPAEPPNAGLRFERLPAISWSSRDRYSARGRDAAQQELRPPGTD
jgi:hypothetical protein